MDYSGKAIDWCRKLGWPAQAVYRPYNTYTRRAVDLWNGIDVLALDGLPGTLGIQATGKGHHAIDHIRKLRGVCAAWPGELASKRAHPKTGKVWEHLPETHPLLLFLEAGNRLQIWAFRKVSKVRGGKVKVWQPRLLQVTPSSLTSFAEPSSTEELEIPLPPLPQSRAAT